MNIVLTIWISLNCFVTGIVIDRYLIQKKISKRIKVRKEMEMIAGELAKRYANYDSDKEPENEEEQFGQYYIQWYTAEEANNGCIKEELQKINKEIDLLNIFEGKNK